VKENQMSGASGKRILVVDDEPDAVEFVRAVMEEAGHEVVSASNGDEGLQAARSEGPDLIILDVQMPGKDGFTTFAELRQDDDLAAIPVVMLTGVGEKLGIGFTSEDMGDFIGQEPDAYVEKPVDPARLTETVESLLGA
jgi:CheY-like chemotaxis protein